MEKKEEEEEEELAMNHSVHFSRHLAHASWESSCVTATRTKVGRAILVSSKE